ncbi:MAG: CYTH domain-containing protein [Aerococcus sp.]|nr:CYTH domain-containing protein [Aerococcus sp.]
MSQAVETEFKNILSQSEYETLLTTYNLDPASANVQQNLYFDTPDHLLKHLGMGLRLRVTDTYAHLTLKEQAGDYRMIETTDHLNREEGLHILETKILTAGQNVDTVLQKRGIHLKDLQVIGSFVTRRLESPMNHATLVFDACTFKHFNDYELEIETDLPVDDGLTQFKAFLTEHHIPRRPSLHKIQRMQMDQAMYDL